MVTVPAVYVDAKGVVRAWINSLTTTLVGTGKPLPLGAHMRRLRSPDAGAYLVLTSVGGDNRFVAGSRARLSASIWGITVEDADTAAAAYANALLQLTVGNVPMPGAICLTVGDITGPLEVTDSDEAHRLVDADFYLVPA